MYRAILMVERACELGIFNVVWEVYCILISSQVHGMTVYRVVATAKLNWSP